MKNIDALPDSDPVPARPKTVAVTRAARLAILRQTAEQGVVVLKPADSQEITRQATEIGLDDTLTDLAVPDEIKNLPAGPQTTK
jgi:hypothetical protein